MEDEHRKQDSQESVPPTVEQLDEYREVKLAKLHALREEGHDPFREVRYDRTHCAAGIVEKFEDLEGQSVKIAGRLVAKRVQGKAGFADLIDESGRIQLYVRRDNVGEEAFELYKKLDIGDIIGLNGDVMKTRTGQVSVAVREFTLLSKILQTLPEKWHGLQDADQRMRQRYMDVIVNRDVFERLRQRSQALSEIRRFLDGRGFLEVETPMLHPIAGGATAEPFKTYWNALKSDFYLRIAIELHLKRLIVGGLEKVYEIGRVFRNEGVDSRHNPEFTMLELYWAYVDYEDIMQLTEDLIVHTADTVFGTREVEYGEYTLKLDAPFKRMKFDEALRKYAGCGLDQLKTLEDVKREAARLKIDLPLDRGHAHCLDEIFKETVEPHLVQPTFIYDYPKELSPLAKAHPESPDLTYRFELFIATMEVANSFSELNDPVDQRERFETQVEANTGDAGQYIKKWMEFKPRWSYYSYNIKDDDLPHEVNEAYDEFRKFNEWLNNSKRSGDFTFDCDRVAWLFQIAAACVPWKVNNHKMKFVNGRRNTTRRILSDIFDTKHRLQRIATAIHVSEDYPSREPDTDFLLALECGMPPTGGLGIGVDRVMMILTGTPAIREVMWFPQLRQR